MPGPPGPPGPPGASGFGSNFQDFTASANQTLFTLGASPAAGNKVVMVVDQFFFYLGKGIASIAGPNVTWDQAGYFPLQAGQNVRLYF